MWRNGRRNGLKIRWPERAVRVRVPPSAGGRFAFGVQTRSHRQSEQVHCPSFRLELFSSKLQLNCGGRMRLRGSVGLSFSSLVRPPSPYLHSFLMGDPIDRESSHFITIRQTKLFFDVCSMGLDSLNAEVQILCHRFRALSFPQHGQNL